MKYYFLYRPPSIGTHPSGETGREVLMPRQTIPGEERRFALGWVTYNEALSFDQLWSYELFPDDTAERASYLSWLDDLQRVT